MSSTPYRSRPVARSHKRNTPRRKLSTSTLFLLVIGVFVAYSSYFVLTVSGDDRRKVANDQPSTTFRNEVLPLDLSPEQERGADYHPASPHLAQAAPDENAPEGSETPPGSNPAAQQSVPPEKKEAPAEAAKGETEEAKESAAEEARKPKAKGEEQPAPESGTEESKGEEKKEEPKKEEPKEEPKKEEQKEPEKKPADEVREYAGEASKPAEPDKVREVFSGEGQPAVSEAAGAVASASQQVASGENYVVVRSGPSPQEEACRTLTLDASKSSDPDNDKLTYEWDFGDGSPKSDQVRVKHTFPQAGDYKVILQVTDNTEGKCSVSAKEQLVHVNVPPVAVGVFPKKLNVGENGIFDGRRSYDTPGDHLTHEWDFSDGEKAQSAILPHRFTQTGEYRVVLTVKDGAAQCNTSVAAYNVLVEEAVAVAPKPVEPLTVPEPAQPRLREPEVAAPAPTPALLYPEGPERRKKEYEWELRNYIDRLDQQRRLAESELSSSVYEREKADAEMEGLLVQIRAHQGEEEPAPKPVAEEPKPQVAAPRIEAPVQPVLLTADVPMPERPEVTEGPKFIPDTHKYVLAWAGGYLVSCPSIGCHTESEVAYRGRMERRLGYLIDAVKEDRDLLRTLHTTSQESKARILKYDKNLENLQLELLRFKDESSRFQRGQFARMDKELGDLSQKVQASHTELLGTSKETADLARRVGEEVLEHARDDLRHRNPYETQTSYTTVTPSKEEAPSIRIAPEK